MPWKYAARRLFKSPMFAALTIATLAIGIGANSAIFSVINGILLKPLPYPHSEELISVDHLAPGVNLPRAGVAPFLYFTYKEQATTFEHFGIWDSGSVSVTGIAEPEQVDSIDVTFGVLPALSVAPLLGRWFSEKDDSPAGAKTMVLLYPYWQSRFGGDRSVIGRRLVVDGEAEEIIGVMPENFRFLDQKPALLQAMRMDRSKIYLGNFGNLGIARLKPGTSLAQANADIARLIPVSLHSFPPYPGYGVREFEEARLTPDLKPLKQELVGDVGKTLWVLMATIGMVLLIACANVANLLLVRAESRRHELAIRAGWSRIARELLAESVLLGLLGGVAGLGVAYGAVRTLVAMAPAHLPRLEEISIDAPVLIFTLAVSLFAGLLFGAIPAIKCAGPGVALALRAGGRSMSQSRERHRARSVLVVVQVALALLLLIGSGLMIRTFQALRNVQPGFTNPAEVETLRITIPETQVRDSLAAVRMEQAILEKIKSIPGVSAAGLASVVPMDGGGWTNPVEAEDHANPPGKLGALRRFKFISPGLLGAMGNTLVAGREFNWQETFDKRPVAMVSENLARELWHDPAAALGKRIRENGTEAWREIVGVVGDEREDGVNKKAPPLAYWPILMTDFSGNPIFVRRSLVYVIRGSRTGTRGFLNDIQRAVWSVNPDLPLAQVQTLAHIYEKSLARTSFTLVLLAMAGAMAMLIGLVGIYGVISYSVSQRTREIGIRMALGAPKQEVTRMFIAHGVLLAAIGVGCGLAGAMALTRWMSSLLFAVSPLDPVTYAAVSILLICAALLASAVPAWRATSIDPLDALRAE
jgi:putative ABC transport system permease protein